MNEKVIVRESTVRCMVRNALDRPVNTNATVDPSASLTDPNDTRFRPQNDVEFTVAVNDMLKHASPALVARAYDAVKSVVGMPDGPVVVPNGDPRFEKDSGEGTKMSDDRKVNVESVVRAAVRNVLSEMPAPKRKRKNKKNEMMVDVEGATFHDIAAELGFSVAGAKQAVDKALQKAQFIGTMDPDDLEVVVLNTMNEYIKYLQRSGELTQEDVELMKMHPDMLRELPGFRDFLDKKIRKLRKEAGSVGADDAQL